MGPPPAMKFPLICPPHMALRRLLRVCLALAVFGFFPLAAKVAAAKNDDSLVPVTVQLKWKNQFQFAGYYMALEKGYYADAGMDVRLIEAVVGRKPMKEVVEGRADFGVGTTDLLLMRNQGLPVVVLAAIFQHSPLAMMVKGDTGIFNVHQLARKKLMIEPHSAELFAYFSKEGVDVDGMEIVDHTFDVKDLLQGQVGGMSVYMTDEPFLLNAAGIEYRLLRPIESGIDFYGDNLFTMEATIRDHPERVAAFVAATRKGWKYALDNIGETVDLILRKYPTKKSRGHLMFEAEHTKSLILPDIVEVGYMNPFRWERIAQTYMDLGLLPKNFSLRGLIYSPAREEIPTWVWRAMIASAVVALLTFLIAAYVIRINYKLRLSEKRLAASNLHKEVLLSIVGHDVKNTIFAVRRYGELLAGGPDTLDRDEVVKHGRQVLLGVDTAMDVLDNLLQWATVQQTDGELQIRPVDLAPIVERNLELFRFQAEAKNITISASELDGATVLGDEWRIDAVVRNLLDNALKFTESSGAITVQVDRSGANLELIVEDTGVGMAEQDLSDVFITRNLKGIGTMGERGTGFGLPLCKQLMESIGGGLTLENNPGDGLRARIRFSKAADAL